MESLSPRNILLGSVVAAIGIVGLFFIWKATSGLSPTTSSNSAKIIVEADDHTKGKADSKILLVEYSDFQCPACGAFFPIVTQVVDKYKDKIRFIYRHYPLPQHKNANAASLAAEAAGDQDKFWEMHDKLFGSQEDWSESETVAKLFEGYAKELKLDMTKYNATLKDSKLQDRIDKDIASGNEYGVNSTPTFYLNGKKLQNIRSAEDFNKAIEKAISAQ